MKPLALNKSRYRSKFEIRPFSEKDIEQVMKLSKSHFPENINADVVQLKINLKKSLDAPNRSLVCRSSSDTICAFLSVKIMDFNFAGEHIKGAIFSDFMANDNARAALIPMQMLQRALKGPQDFSFTEDAIHASRLLWCRLGGQIAFPYSSYYNIILRPTTFAAKMAGKKLPPTLKSLANKVGRGSDVLIKKLPLSALKHSMPEGFSVKKLTADQFDTGMDVIISRKPLHPMINNTVLDRFLNLVKSETQFGIPVTSAIYDASDNIIGWFIYYLNNKGRCNVIHAESIPGKEDVLYSALKADAYERGGVFMTGRLSPSQIGSSFSEDTISRPGGKWALVHSNRPEILQTIQSGQAFLSRCW